MKDSKYAQALGRWEFEINGTPFSLKPAKGDNLKFLRLQQKYEKDQLGLLEAFVPYMTELICRAEPEANPDEVEMFVERNTIAFFKETLIAFGWTTRDKLQETEDVALKKSLQGVA